MSRSPTPTELGTLANVVPIVVTQDNSLILTGHDADQYLTVWRQADAAGTVQTWKSRRLRCMRLADFVAFLTAQVDSAPRETADNLARRLNLTG